MVKKIFFAIFILSLNIATFSKEQISDVTNSKNEIQIYFENKKPKIEFDESYDMKNKLLFLNLKNCGITEAEKFVDVISKNSAIASAKFVVMGENLGVFLQHNKNFVYTLNKKNNSLLISFNDSLATQNKKFTIVIDPGHGGKDPGGMGFKKKEKDVVLYVAKVLREELQEEFNVILTRDTDEFIPLGTRPDVANKKNADMFVSLHVNASSNSKANGMEVFYFSKTSSPYAARIASYENSFGDEFGEKTDDISQILGELEYKKYQEISAKFGNTLNTALANKLKMKNNGIEGANFAVLRGLGRPNTAIPGVLVELGFISNKTEMTKITNLKNQNIMAKTIAEEIKKYFN